VRDVEGADIPAAPTQRSGIPGERSIAAEHAQIDRFDAILFGAPSPVVVDGAETARCFLIDVYKRQPHMVLAKSPRPSADSNAACSNGETKNALARWAW